MGAGGADVRELFGELGRAGSSTSQIKKLRAALSAMFATAVEDGKLRSNSCQGVRMPPVFASKAGTELGPANVYRRVLVPAAQGVGLTVEVQGEDGRRRLRSTVSFHTRSAIRAPRFFSRPDATSSRCRSGSDTPIPPSLSEPTFT
jgi:hypothetical protein